MSSTELTPKTDRIALDATRHTHQCAGNCGGQVFCRACDDAASTYGPNMCVGCEEEAEKNVKANARRRDAATNAQAVPVTAMLSN